MLLSLRASTWPFPSPEPDSSWPDPERLLLSPEVSALALVTQPLCNLVSFHTESSRDSTSLRSKSKAFATAMRSHGRDLLSDLVSQFSPLRPL